MRSGLQSLRAGLRRRDGCAFAEPSKRRIVIADDSPAHLELFALALGWISTLEIVGIANDGGEAVQLAVAHDADVALLEVELPNLDGFDAAEEIHRLRPDTNVILHTSARADEYRRRASELGLSLFGKFELLGLIEVAGGAFA